MKSKFNMDLLFEKSNRINIKELEIFKKAALLYRFNLRDDFKEFDEKDIKFLKDHSFKRPDGTYRLRKDDRLEILSKSIGISNLGKYIDQFSIKSEFSQVIKSILESPRVDINNFSNVKLYYAGILSELFPDKLNSGEVWSTYQRRQFFKQFEQLIKNFAGRKEELAEISDYVDWLPKSTVYETIKFAVRNIIKWHEKPPMLINGIGGIGKSTIISKFILDQNNQENGKQLPFVYIDFDLPGFSIREPLSILIEALRQINIQYPENKKLIDEISKTISELIYSGAREDLTSQKSSASTRGFVYYSIEDVIRRYDLTVKKLGQTPIMVVFDSFEEIQYRATSNELYSFFMFLKEISELIPRVRPIFVGRAEIWDDFEDFDFHTLQIKDFDIVSADALLEKTGVNDKETRSFIYANFGGNPLMLRLATDVAMKEGFNLSDRETVKGKKWEYLVNRILGHIHNEDVSKVAVPGMLVRYINPEIIKIVLAKPTKLGEIDDKKAKYIFDELKKEAALISRFLGYDEFSFRQDLRMTCENMILEKYPEESKEIRQNAITYYSKFKEIADTEKHNLYKAEYFFHIMKSGIIPKDLSLKEYDRFRSFLEHSIIELPESARLFLRSLGRQNVSDKIINDSTDQEWEYYQLQIIKDALNGELDNIEVIYEKLINKKLRIDEGFSELGKFEALLYQRLNNLKLSNEFIYRALSSNATPQKLNNNLFIEFQLLLIQNMEYDERYNEALKVLDEIRSESIQLDINQRMKIEFLENRMKSRIELNRSSLSPRIFSELEYVVTEDFRDTKWEFIFSNIDFNSTKFKSHNQLNREFRELRKNLRKIEVLEEYSVKHTKYFLKDITYTGTFDIVLRDFLFVEEILNNNRVK